MQTWRSCVLSTLLLIACVPRAAAGEEAGKVGVVTGFPAAVGVIWHPVDRIAVRPEFTFAFQSTDLPTIEGGTNESSSTSVGVGASVLFYLNERDNLRMYVAPRFAYDHDSLNLGPSIMALPVSFAPDIKTSTYSTTGSFGAQYSLNRRFGAFGELGLEYRHSSVEPSFAFQTKSTSHAWGVRTGVGVILYF